MSQPLSRLGQQLEEAIATFAPAETFRLAGAYVSLFVNNLFDANPLLNKWNKL